MTKYVITIRPISLARLTKVLGYSDIPHSRFAIFKLWIRKFYLLSIISILLALPLQVKVKMYCSKNMPMGKHISILIVFNCKVPQPFYFNIILG